MSATDLPAPARLRRPTQSFGPFTFDRDNQQLRRGVQDIAAPPRVLGVLDVLLERAGDLVLRQELIDRVWKDAFVTDTSLAEAVSALRQILEDDPQSPTYIQTVHRRGYRFVAPVEAHERRAVAVKPPVPDIPASDLVSPSIGGQLVPWGLAVLCALLAAAALYQLTHRREPAVMEGRFSLQLEPGQRFDSRGSAVALSPDGDAAAWAACASDGCRLYVRPLDRLEPIGIAGTEDATSPFYSPDGAWLGFFAGGKLKRVALSGGAPTTIADVAQPLGAVWTDDGRIIFGSSLAGGLAQVSENGGLPQPLTTPHQEVGEVRHAWPALSRDGRTLFFSIGTALEEDSASRLGVATLQIGGGLHSRVSSWTTLSNGLGIARPMSDDLIVFARGPELQVVRFDPVGRTLVGVPQTLVSAVAVVEGRAQFAVSTSGSLLYVLHGSRAADPRLAWWLGPGSEQPAPALDIAGAPRLSNDGRRLAWVGSSDGARADVRLSDLERGAVTRLTHDGLSSSPVWSGDGQHVYYARRDDRLFHVVSIDADGGRSTSMAPGAGHMFPGSVSGDGQVLATTVAGRETKRDIWITSTSGASPPRAIAQSPFDEAAPSLSRDGSLVAYESDESGRWDVYVQRISDGRRVIVSTAGGEEPFWAVDGSAIMYRAGMALMRASLDSRTLTVGSPATLGELRGDVPLGIAPDGRILIDRRSGLAGSSAVIALHWDREARRLLGPPAGAMPR